MIDHKKFFDGFRTAFGPLKQLQVDGLTFLLLSFETRAEWSDLRHRAYALATIKRETGIQRKVNGVWTDMTYQPIEEAGGKIYLSKYYLNPRLRRALGNTSLNDAFKFKGRGFIQITGRANYTKFEIADAPEKALEPDVAFQIMTEGMHKGLFTGKRLSQFTISGAVQMFDYFNARKIINGLDHADEIAEDAKKFERILRAANSL